MWLRWAWLWAILPSVAAAHDWHDPQRNNTTVYVPGQAGPVSLLLQIHDADVTGALRMDLSAFVEGSVDDATSFSTRLRVAAEHLEELLHFESGGQPVPVRVRMPDAEGLARLDKVGHERVELWLERPDGELALTVPEEWLPLRLALVQDADVKLSTVAPGERVLLVAGPPAQTRNVQQSRAPLPSHVWRGLLLVVVLLIGAAAAFAVRRARIRRRGDTG